MPCSHSDSCGVYFHTSMKRFLPPQVFLLWHFLLLFWFVVLCFIVAFWFVFFPLIVTEKAWTFVCISNEVSWLTLLCSFCSSRLSSNTFSISIYNKCVFWRWTFEYYYNCFCFLTCLNHLMVDGLFLKCMTLSSV